MDTARRDLDFLLQPYRVVLLQVPGLMERFTELQAARQLHTAPQALTPLLLQAISGHFGDRLTTIVPTGTETMAMQGVLAALTAAMGEGADRELANWLVAEPPPVVTLLRHLTPEAKVGFYRTGERALLMRLHVVWKHLRPDGGGGAGGGAGGDQMRIFLDRRVRGGGEKGLGKGKGKGKDKGKKGKGKGKGKGKAAAKGGARRATGQRPDRERSRGRDEADGVEEALRRAAEAAQAVRANPEG